MNLTLCEVKGAGFKIVYIVWFYLYGNLEYELICTGRKPIRHSLELEVDGKIDCKGSWGGRNMYFDCGSGYIGAYICQKPLTWTFNLGVLLYISYSSIKWMLLKKKDLTSLIIRKIQTKVIVRYYFIPI